VSDKASAVASGTVAPLVGDSHVSRLAEFFPAATPVRLPVRVFAAAGRSEQTVIEYGTSQEVLFASALPLEFGERVRLRNADGSLDTEAFVVALQWQSGHTAVAARFAHEVSNWIVKP
jgi:hypothetical protein